MPLHICFLSDTGPLCNQAAAWAPPLLAQGHSFVPPSVRSDMPHRRTSASTAPPHRRTTAAAPHRTAAPPHDHHRTVCRFRPASALVTAPLQPYGCTTPTYHPSYLPQMHRRWTAYNCTSTRLTALPPRTCRPACRPAHAAPHMPPRAAAPCTHLTAAPYCRPTLPPRTCRPALPPCTAAPCNPNPYLFLAARANPKLNP